MRILLFFDVPSVTYEDKAEYRSFRKNLLSNGFVMMQESVYCKLAINQNSVDSTLKKISSSIPQMGIVEVLVITEKQFAGIKYLKGEKQSKVIDTMERLTII